MLLPSIAAAQVLPKNGDTAGAGAYPYLGTARTLGMGGAYTAVADDNAGLWWNPAGVTQILANQGQASVEVNEDEVDYFQVSYVAPEPNLGGLSTGYGLISGKIEGAGGAGVDRKDLVLQYSIGQRYDERTAFGASLKYHDVDLKPVSSDKGFSFDLGLLYDYPLNIEPDEEGFAPTLKLGLSVLDINEPSFDRIGLQRRTLNLGGAYQVDPGTWVALDFHDLGDHAKRQEIRLGGERLVTDRILVRAGFAGSDFAIGFGILYRSFTVDFGFRRVADEPDLNILSVYAGF